MMLARLLSKIEAANGPITGVELANQLEVSPNEVAAMLVALRASGQLGPEVRKEQAPESCTVAGPCSMSCPGPDRCALTVDLSVTGLEIRRF